MNFKITLGQMEDSDNLFERGLYRSTYTYFMDHWKK